MSSLREKHIESMTPRKGNVKPIFRLRWVFHWLDGKVKRGVWNGASNDFGSSAASINKSGLIFAGIEAEDSIGNGITKFYECDGHDYITAKWIAAGSIGAPIGKWNSESIKVTPDIIGLSILTRKERVSVFIDGSISSRPHKLVEKIEKIREHNL